MGLLSDYKEQDVCGSCEQFKERVADELGYKECPGCSGWMESHVTMLGCGRVELPYKEFDGWKCYQCMGSDKKG